MNRRTVSVAMAALLLAGCAGGAAGLYEEDGDVVMLDSGNFNEVVMETKAIVLVHFFKPGHNENFAPEYAKVASNLKDIIKLGAVDFDAEPKLFQKMGITKLPSFKVFVDGKTRNPYTGEVSRIPQDFEAPATASALAKALKALLPKEHIQSVASQADWDDFRWKGDGLPTALLATTSTTTTPLYKSLSLRFLGRMRFGEVRSTVTTDLEGFPEVEAFPQLSVTLPSGERKVYEGQLQAAKLIEFLEEYAAPPPEEEDLQGGASSDSNKGKKEAPSSASSPLKLLEADAFEASVLEEELPVLVAFVGGAHEEEEGAASECSQQEEELQEAAAGAAGMLPMFLVRVTKGEKGEEVASAFSDDETTLSAALLSEPCKPKLALFPQGSEQKADDGPEIFLPGDDPVPTKKELQDFVYSAMPNRVDRVTGAIFNQYVATEVGTVKVILMTAKDETPGMFRALAMNYPQFHFAEVHKSEKEVVSQFPNAKFPSVYLLAPAPSSPDQEEGGIQIIPLQGPYNFAALSKILDDIVRQKEAAESGASGDASSGSGTSSAAAGVLTEVSTHAGFQDACVATGRLCVVAFLDGASGGDALEKQIATMKSVMAKSAGAPVSFQWMDGRKQPEFAAALDVRTSDLPTVAVVSPQKQRYATLRGAFSEQYITALLTGIMSNKVKTHVIQELPRVVDGGVQEEEADYEAIEEEEFDLSDIMDEEVEAAVTNEERLKEIEEELEQEAAKAKAEAEAAKQAAKKASSKKSKSKKSSKKSKSKKGSKNKDEL